MGENKRKNDRQVCKVCGGKSRSKWHAYCLPCTPAGILARTQQNRESGATKPQRPMPDADIEALIDRADRDTWNLEPHWLRST